MNIIKMIFLISMGLSAFFAKAQLKPIPIGTWRSHFDYSKGNSIAALGDKIYSAAKIGLFVYDVSDNEATILGVDDGLSDLNISQIAYHLPTNTLVIAYKSGAIDLADLDNNGEIKKINTLLAVKNASTIFDSKATNDIALNGNIAFLSTDFGIVQIDLPKKQIKETILNLSASGESRRVFSCAFEQSKIVAITEANIIEADLNGNLQNFNNWQYLPLPKSSKLANNKVVKANGQFYLFFKGDGLYSYANQKVQKLFDLAESASAIFVKDNMINIALPKKLLNYDLANKKVETNTEELLKKPNQLLYLNQKLWVADLENGLLSNFEGSFKKYNPKENLGINTSRIDSSVTDQQGITYSKLGPGSGLKINNKAGQSRIFGLVPLLQNNTRNSSTINSIVVDKNNTVFVGVNGGIVALNSDENILNSQNLTEFVNTPVIGNVRTLANEIVLSIAVDGANRKWIGTSTGLYLFNEDLSELIQKFTDVNSPLPSNTINYLNIDPLTGELFVNTENGIISYRTDATESEDVQNSSSVLVFPNPVRPNFEGVVGISGLLANASVKITDVSGRLVYQTQANGGTATWALNTQNGKRAESGIYFIFSSNEFGQESLVSKLAIIK
jgi:hypothetical protein